MDYEEYAIVLNKVYFFNFPIPCFNINTIKIAFF